MFKYFTRIAFKTIIAILLWQTPAFHVLAQPHDVNLTIHLRGVSESKISLMGLSGTKAFKTIVEMQGIKTAKLLR